MTVKCVCEAKRKQLCKGRFRKKLQTLNLGHQGDVQPRADTVDAQHVAARDGKRV